MIERRSKAGERLTYHTDRAQQGWIAEDAALLASVTRHDEARLIECIDPERPSAAPKRRGRLFRR